MRLFSFRRNRSSRPVQRPARVRPTLENLEDRCVPSAVTTVFVETNSPIAGDNAVLAFRRDGNGGLHEIGQFATGGTGQINLPKVIGPDDSSQEVVATPDGRFLFAVNQGSHSVTSFRIDPNGGLDRIGVFDSGGVQPDSLGISGNRLYVSNRGDSATGHPGTVAPNITGFTIGTNGSLTPIPNSTVTFPVDTSPSQNLISRDGRFLFADIFAVPGSTAAQGNTFAPFQIQADGTLKLAPGGNVGAPVTPALLLGSAVHPKLNIIYAGLTGANQVGVFTFDETGKLSFVGAAPDQGFAACWVEVSADGRFLYETSTGSNTVGVFSLADPLHPVEIQSFVLGGPQAPPGSPAGTRETADFQLALDPSGRFLYVINQSTDAKGLFPQGNQLHVLDVGRDGKLSEPTGPLVFSQAEVPSVAHPQGIAVVSTESARPDVRSQSLADRSGSDPSSSDQALRSRSSFSAALDDVLDILLQEQRDRNRAR
jgi:6-phosphogluconolactonase (cycloisomerase 2 family)